MASHFSPVLVTAHQLQSCSKLRPSFVAVRRCDFALGIDFTPYKTSSFYRICDLGFGWRGSVCVSDEDWDNMPLDHVECDIYGRHPCVSGDTCGLVQLGNDFTLGKVVFDRKWEEAWPPGNYRLQNWLLILNWEDKSNCKFDMCMNLVSNYV